MRTMLATPLLLLALACGGDTTTAPPPFPAVGGTYGITITFEDFAASQVSGAGIITVTQASRYASDLSGTADILFYVDGDRYRVATLSQASVTEGGTIHFNLAPPNSTSTWRFDGTVSTDGARMNGTHLLVGSSTFAGNWTAVRQ
jgi:hypothetical protein